MPATARKTAPAKTRRAANKTALREAVAALNAGNPEDYLALFAPDATLHGFPAGIEDVDDLCRFHAATADTLPRRGRDARRRDRRERPRRDALHVAREPGPRLGARGPRRRDRALRRRADRRVLEPAGRDPRRRLVAWPRPLGSRRGRRDPGGRRGRGARDGRAAGGARRGADAARATRRRARPSCGARSPSSASSRSTCRSTARRSSATRRGAPFSWDVAGKANVLADWQPAGAADGRSLILNGHIDVVSPEPSSLWTRDPFARAVDGEWMYGRGAGDMKSGLAAMVGAVRGLQRLGLAPARAGPAAVGRRGGVHRQRRARLRAGRAHRRRRDPDRADARRDLERAGRRAVVPGARARRARARRRRGRGRQRDRGLVRRDRGAARAGGRAQRRRRRRCTPPIPTRSTSTSG